MKSISVFLAASVVLGLLAGCVAKPVRQQYDTVEIQLQDSQITVDGSVAGTDPAAAVYTARDIVYYESGKDFTYGEGTEKDAHSVEEAAEHTVVHITQPGTYSVTGTLSKGQIAVDLGEDAKKDTKAVVTLILNGLDITCEVAPAIIFYNVYECGDAQKPAKDVDTSAAGANVILADGSENTVRGSYVARIYKPDSVELNAEGTEVEEAKKLHKYDGAFYSKMSMNVKGEKENTGMLNIFAENEGLDTELHLTLAGGNVNIYSGNDGINTNEDGVSVTTVNGGSLFVKVTGETGEGDGIDSNGWLVINGGSVTAYACSSSADAGIDSDMGIHINGGTVLATGHMLDHIEAGGQSYAVFNFSQKQDGLRLVVLKDEKGKALLEHCPENQYSVLVFSASQLEEGEYTLWSGQTQMEGYNGGMSGGPGVRPEGMKPPEGGSPEGFQPPDGDRPLGQKPDGMRPPEGEMPQKPPERPDGGDWNPGDDSSSNQEKSTVFQIKQGVNMFSGISPVASSDATTDSIQFGDLFL